MIHEDRESRDGTGGPIWSYLFACLEIFHKICSEIVFDFALTSFDLPSVRDPPPTPPHITGKFPSVDKHVDQEFPSR